MLSRARTRPPPRRSRRSHPRPTRAAQNVPGAPQPRVRGASQLHRRHRARGASADDRGGGDAGEHARDSTIRSDRASRAKGRGSRRFMATRGARPARLSSSSPASDVHARADLRAAWAGSVDRAAGPACGCEPAPSTWPCTALHGRSKHDRPPTIHDHAIIEM